MFENKGIFLKSQLKIIFNTKIDLIKYFLLNQYFTAKDIFVICSFIVISKCKDK